MNEHKARGLLRAVINGLDPMSYRLADRDARPAIGDKVIVTMPDGTTRETVVTALLYGAKRYECFVSGMFVQFADEDVEPSR